MSAGYPLFVKRDLDGFFGLFIDNLVQLLLIVNLSGLAGIGADSPLLLDAILPGAAVSILLGNIFYAWQAHRLAARENRSDVTALPYGINTPSLLVYIFFVMQPAYQQAVQDGKAAEEAARHAWQMGLVACLGSGLIEFVGAFVAEAVRKRTPRAALLSTLAGIAIGFISMTFTLQIFQRPLVAMVPLALILITYFSRIGFPLGLPGGLMAVALGTAAAWILTLLKLPPSLVGPPMSVDEIGKAWAARGLHLPQFAGMALWEAASQPARWAGFLSVIVPMGLFNVIGSLQNIESAEAGGDRYSTMESLAVNGLSTIAAALFGSCFPTTIYIGHPGWKGLGARAGYSTLNGLAITAICLTGTVSVIHRIVPMEAGVAIVLWIGIVITAQAFQASPKEHAPAVAVGLFPAIAAWGATVVQGAFFASGGKTMQELLTRNISTEVNGFLLHGLIVMERGYIFTCMILSAVTAFLIERKFFAAAAWSLIATACAFFGLTHAYSIQGNNFDFLIGLPPDLFGQRADAANTPDVVAGAAASLPATSTAVTYPATGLAIGYLAFAIVIALFGWYHRRNPHVETAAH
jgi:AGZA family xanthine/uracil permease-like MFS transporter